jgi:hypothetical protein
VKCRDEITVRPGLFLDVDMVRKLVTENAVDPRRADRQDPPSAARQRALSISWPRF